MNDSLYCDLGTSNATHPFDFFSGGGKQDRAKIQNLTLSARASANAVEIVQK